MTTKQERTESERAADRAILIAVVSPVLAGFVWAALTYVSSRVEFASSEASLATFIAFWAMVVLGLLGFGALAVPMAIGLTARDPLTRLAAASVGTAIAALAGTFWLLGAVGADLGGLLEALGYAAAAVLFLPLITLAAAFRANR